MERTEPIDTGAVKATLPCVTVVLVTNKRDVLEVPNPMVETLDQLQARFDEHPGWSLRTMIALHGVECNASVVKRLRVQTIALPIGAGSLMWARKQCVRYLMCHSTTPSNYVWFLDDDDTLNVDQAQLILSQVFDEISKSQEIGPQLFCLTRSVTIGSIRRTLGTPLSRIQSAGCIAWWSKIVRLDLALAVINSIPDDVSIFEDTWSTLLMSTLVSDQIVWLYQPYNYSGGHMVQSFSAILQAEQANVGSDNQGATLDALKQMRAFLIMRQHVLSNAKEVADSTEKLTRVVNSLLINSTNETTA